MSEQPSNAELAWRLTQIHEEQQRQRSDLRQVVGHPEYAADKRGTDRRFADIEDDMRRAFERIEAHEKGHSENQRSWQQIVWTAVPASLVALLAILAQLWVGGH